VDEAVLDWANKDCSRSSILMVAGVVESGSDEGVGKDLMAVSMVWIVLRYAVGGGLAGVMGDGLVGKRVLKESEPGFIMFKAADLAVAPGTGRGGLN
jgi:hypothetical protein